MRQIVIFSQRKKAYADKLSANQKYKRLRIHNGLLNCLYDNPSFLVNYTKDSCNFKMPINGPRPLTKEIIVENDNIERVFFGGETSWSSDFTKWQCAVDIKYSNYIEISFQRPIKLNEVKRYLDKINFFINAYCFKKKNASHVTLFTELGEEYDLFCQSIKANQECDGLLYFPIKMDFFDYFEKVLKEIDYETLKEENKLSPLQNKELSSLEDSFLYYYKYIDRFMGTIISKQERKKTTQKQHIGKFVEVYKYLFKKDMQLDEDLGIKAVSLRNHYAHEGYFFTKGEFSVKDNGKVKYRMAIDYDWLRDLVFTLKVGSITMLLKEYLHLEIDENAVLNACLKQLD